MKRVVSVSLGSSKRDHLVRVNFLGEEFEISRRGTDGDFQQALALLRSLDGEVDAIGLGGIDVYLYAGTTRYVVRDGLKMMAAVQQTPVVDGSGLKNTLERQTVQYLHQHGDWVGLGTKVLMVSAVDRFGMAEAFVALGCDVVFGDLMFVTGIPYAIRSLTGLERLARVVLPQMAKLPFRMLYPTGKKQEMRNGKKIAQLGHYYQEAQIIAGDFHLVKKYMPEGLQGQVVVTNTTTKEDVAFLRACGVGTLITSTPVFEGRSFGTNVMEAVLVALSGKRPEELTEADYLALLQRMDCKPRIEVLQPLEQGKHLG